MPIRKVQHATHFKPVEMDGKTMWQPCSPGDSQAVEKNWMSLTADELKEPELSLNDFEKAIGNSRPTVNQADLEKQTQFTADFGSVT